MVFNFHASFGSTFSISFDCYLGHALSFAFTLCIRIAQGFDCPIRLLQIFCATQADTAVGQGYFLFLVQQSRSFFKCLFRHGQITLDVFWITVIGQSQITFVAFQYRQNALGGFVNKGLSFFLGTYGYFVVLYFADISFDFISLSISAQHFLLEKEPHVFAFDDHSTPQFHAFADDHIYFVTTIKRNISIFNVGI
jgi:hypothetical protein